MIRAFLLTLLFCLSASAADDLADAKVAFTNLVNYQKNNGMSTDNNHKNRMIFVTWHRGLQSLATIL